MLPNRRNDIETTVESLLITCKGAIKKIGEINKDQLQKLSGSKESSQIIDPASRY